MLNKISGDSNDRNNPEKTDAFNASKTFKLTHLMSKGM